MKKILTTCCTAMTVLALGLIGLTGCSAEPPATAEPSPGAPAGAATPGAARSNPTGTGATTSVTIDNAVGASVALPNGTKLDVPPGALPPGVETITITSSLDAAPADYVASSPVYVFGPDGTVFLKPVRISIPVTLPPGVNASDLTILWSRARLDGFDMVPSELVSVAGSPSELLAVGEVTHFSLGFIGLKFTTDPRPTPDPYAGN